MTEPNRRSVSDQRMRASSSTTRIVAVGMMLTRFNGAAMAPQLLNQVGEPVFRGAEYARSSPASYAVADLGVRCAPRPVPPHRRASRSRFTRTAAPADSGRIPGNALYAVDRGAIGASVRTQQSCMCANPGDACEGGDSLDGIGWAVGRALARVRCVCTASVAGGGSPGVRTFPRSWGFFC